MYSTRTLYLNIVPSIFNFPRDEDPWQRGESVLAREAPAVQAREAPAVQAREAPVVLAREAPAVQAREAPAAFCAKARARARARARVKVKVKDTRTPRISEPIHAGR